MHCLRTLHRYDGHGGHAVAQHCSQRLHVHLQQALHQHLTPPTAAAQAGGDGPHLSLLNAPRRQTLASAAALLSATQHVRPAPALTPDPQLPPGRAPSPAQPRGAPASGAAVAALAALAPASPRAATSPPASQPPPQHHRTSSLQSELHATLALLRSNNSNLAPAAEDAAATVPTHSNDAHALPLPPGAARAPLPPEAGLPALPAVATLPPDRPLLAAVAARAVHRAGLAAAASDALGAAAGLLAVSADSPDSRTSAVGPTPFAAASNRRALMLESDNGRAPGSAPRTESDNSTAASASAAAALSGPSATSAAANAVRPPACPRLRAIRSPRQHCVARLRGGATHACTAAPCPLSRA